MSPLPCGSPRPSGGSDATSVAQAALRRRQGILVAERLRDLAQPQPVQAAQIVRTLSSRLSREVRVSEDGVAMHIDTDGQPAGRAEPANATRAPAPTEEEAAASVLAAVAGQPAARAATSAFGAQQPAEARPSYRTAQPEQRRQSPLGAEIAAHANFAVEQMQQKLRAMAQDNPNMTLGDAMIKSGISGLLPDVLLPRVGRAGIAPVIKASEVFVPVRLPPGVTPERVRAAVAQMGLDASQVFSGGQPASQSAAGGGTNGDAAADAESPTFTKARRSRKPKRDGKGASASAFGHVDVPQRDEAAIKQEDAGLSLSPGGWRMLQMAHGTRRTGKPLTPPRVARPAARRLAPPEGRAAYAPLEGDANVGLVYDDMMLLHRAPPEHPENPERLTAIFARLHRQGIVHRCARVRSRDATHEELVRVHTEEHISEMEGAFDPDGPEIQVPPAKLGDIYFSAGTAKAARLAAGSVIEASQRVLAGDVDRAFAIVRPPGHHAECCQAMGFCFFNSVAAAAAEAVASGTAKKVLIVDWDVHHGNGTQQIFSEDGKVLYMSLHRFSDDGSFFPGTGDADDVGEGDGEGFSVNVPWRDRGLGAEDYAAAFEHLIMPVARAHDPDLVLVSAGFDGALGDPLGGMRLAPAAFAWMTNELLSLAGGRMVVALEGGYKPDVISLCAEAVVRTLLGEESAHKEALRPGRNAKASTAAALAHVLEVQRRYWPLLREPAARSSFDTFAAEVEKATASPSSESTKAGRQRKSRSASSTSASVGDDSPSSSEQSPSGWGSRRARSSSRASEQLDPWSRERD